MPKVKEKPEATEAPTSKPVPFALKAPQIKILQALDEAKGAITRTELAKLSNVSASSMSGYVGSYDEQKRKADDLRYPSLITLGYVKAENKAGEDGKARWLHVLTAAGRKALAAALKAKAT